MAAENTLTIQSGIKEAINADSITKYALFMGGTNVTNDVLACYDPLKTGYARLFMTRKPAFLDKTMPKKLTNFKHILEYGNTSIQGIGDVSVDFKSIEGGYVGKSFEIPTNVADNTNTFTVTVYEFSGSPIRELIHSWINGSIDLMSGLTHYNGEKSLDRIQANQTAEFIYVVTDHTGEKIEYACLFANCFPRGINTDVFNYTSGEHNLVDTGIEFSCTKYESIQINKVAQALLDKYKILTNSLNFYSGYNPTDADLGGGSGFNYNVETGKLETASSVITDPNNVETSAPIDPTVPVNPE